ncbi:hypothetical protein SM124_00475 [Bacillus sp. 31A1R]|uniref:Uncharacterized protein n=1 Tax=Robertmurraya mangrovi TaxID=3098077 RepID=A0ABU5ISV3_9BACI|nr:hypothetical protein [Bacillus sp. 31A1R]MDZ5470209.1 hypothetical protein [Bacillus sp. 31A1R]
MKKENYKVNQPNILTKRKATKEELLELSSTGYGLVSETNKNGFEESGQNSSCGGL